MQAKTQPQIYASKPKSIQKTNKQKQLLIFGAIQTTLVVSQLRREDHHVFSGRLTVHYCKWFIVRQATETYAVVTYIGYSKLAYSIGYGYFSGF